MSGSRIVLFVAIAAAWSAASVNAALREPVHPRRNVDEFAAVEARFVRFTVRATNLGEPCLDELEIYSVGNETRNVALAANGARATSSGSLRGYAIHQLEGINDGRYGNGRSWIADRLNGAWVQIELPQVTRVNKVVWGRDREGKFIDRLVTEYQIDVAVDTNHWETVASSADREPLGVGAQISAHPSPTREFVNRFAPVGTTLSPEAERASSEYVIDVWQTSDGLPANTVTAIAQTPDGYLWVATLNGLARFDGVRFTVFGEADGLPTSRLLCLHADHHGDLWIGTDGGGLATLHNGSFRLLTAREGLINATVNTVTEDSSGRVWIGTKGGLSCWHNGRFVDDPAARSLGQRSISKAQVDGNDTLWCLTYQDIFWRRGAEFVRVQRKEEPSAFTSTFAAHIGHSGQFWYGGANGYVGSLSNGVFRIFREQPGQLLGTTWELCETKNGDVWAGSANSGLRRLRDGRFTSLTTQEGLSDNSVRCLFEDREGTLWVGTIGGGLNRVKARRLTTFTTREGLAHNVVMSLAEDRDGTLWIGSNCGGLSARRNAVLAPYYANYLLDNECIWSLLTGPEGSLWIGTWGGGLFRMRGKQVENYIVARRGIEEPIIALCPDAKKGLWLGTVEGGLKYFCDGAVTQFTTTNGLSANHVTSILQDPSGTLWIGTAGGGLNSYDSGHFKAFTRRDGLPSDSIRTLYRDTQGTLWIGTGGGLARFAGGKFASFTRTEGLPDEVISQILEDNHTNLWFGCNKGIFNVSRPEFEAVVSRKIPRVNPISYGRAEGMESLECTGGFHPAGLKTRDGKLWFSTVKGLVMADPEAITPNPFPPPVTVEKIIVDGKEPVRSSGAHVRDSTSLALSPGVQRVEFHYTALSLVAPERNRFKYRLDGLDHDWVEAGGERVAAYPHLPPGRYTFRVVGCNNDGVWNSSGATLAFAVLPAYWQTWWFQIGLLLALLGGGGWSIRFASVRRLRGKLQRLEEKHAVEKERTRIAQDIHDELGASLTRIALLTELGQKHSHQPDEVTGDLEKISGTARDLVRALDSIVWAVNPHNDSLDHFANYVSQFAEDFFRLTPIRCRLDVPADLPEHPFPTEARHELFLAVKESLNNVVRHSNATEVWLRLRCEADELGIAVEDDGCGLPANSPETGHDGLTNIRARIERLGGRFRVESEPGKGTKLGFSLPLPKAKPRTM